MRRVYFGLVIVGVVLGSVLPVSAQGSERAPITPENADQLALVATLWRGTPTDAAWSADGTLIAIAFTGDQVVTLDDAGRVMRWTLDAAQPDEVINQGIEPVSASAFRADGSLLAVAEQFSGIKTIDTANGQIVSTWDTGPIYGLAISADGGLVAWSDPDGALHVWDGETGEELAAMLSETKMLTHHLAFDLTGTLLASTSLYDETLRLWDVATGREIGQVFVNDGVDAIAFSPDGAMLVAGLGVGGVAAWPVRDFRDWVAIENAIQYFPTQGGASVLAYSPDGSLLAAAEGPIVHIFDAAVASEATVSTELAVVYVGAATALDWSPDGSLLAASGPGGVIRVWGVP